MSIVQSEVYDAFIEAGTSEPKLRAAAEVMVRKPHGDEVATKSDMDRLKARLKAEIANLRISLRGWNPG